MKITLPQVKQDILSGKCKRIYYSSATLWWTHLHSDVEEATILGKAKMEKRHEDLLNSPNIPDSEKKRMKGLFDIVKKGSTPTDPTGAPLYQMDDCNKWIVVAENKPTHFGEGGLDAFMAAHHQNSQGKIFTKWSDINPTSNPPAAVPAD